MSFSHVVNLANQYQPAHTYSGMHSSTRKKRSLYSLTKALLRVKCYRGLRLCSRIFRSFCSLGQRLLTKVLLSLVIILGSLLLLLLALVYAVCLSTFFILTSLLSLSVQLSSTLLPIRLSQQVKTQKLSSPRRQTESGINFIRSGKGRYKM